MLMSGKLYKGKLCPIENSVPHTDEYRHAAHKLAMALVEELPELDDDCGLT